jgi:hypothetical protein
MFLFLINHKNKPKMVTAKALTISETIVFQKAINNISDIIATFSLVA